MKLVIYTQVEENYGVFDWDGTGECPQYWKPKGGSTYVVKNLSERQAERIEKTGIPTLNALLTQSTDSVREYVNGWTVLQDDESECEDWDSPIYLTYNTIAKAWKAVRYQRNDADYGGLHPAVTEKIERWTLAPNGEREAFMCYYRLINGEFTTYENFDEAIKELEAA